MLWALGLVRLNVTPSLADLAERGRLPLTIAFQPKPPHAVTFFIDWKISDVVRADPVVTAASESLFVGTPVHGERMGTVMLRVRLLPTSRLGRSTQKIVQNIAAALGLGCGEVALTVTQPPIFVIAPHPDDEALIASGVIAHAVAKGKPVKVIVVTNGDHLRGKKGYGIERQAESVAAMEKLGLQREGVIFLGYPGDVRGLLHMMNMYLDEKSAYTSAAGVNATYGEHGPGGCDFHSWLTGKPALYNAVNLLNDLETLVRAFRPKEIYTVSRFDEHPDHRAVNYLTHRVLQKLRHEDADYLPTLRTTIVHEPSRDAYEDFWERDKQPPPISVDFAADDFWPAPLEETTGRSDGPVAKFTPPNHLGRTSLSWNNVERLPVPDSMQTAELDANLKYQALQQYESQPLRYLAPFCKQDELFWQEEVPNHELLALSRLETVLRKDEARVMTISLVNPAPRRVAVALESSEPKILAVPPAVIVEAGALTAAFAVRAISAGKATVTAKLGMPRELMSVTVTDTAESLREVIPLKKIHCA